MKARITQHLVNTFTLPKGEEDIFVWDEKFGLRVRRGARDRLLKSYYAQYRLNGRTQRRKLGDKMTLAQARAEAKRVLACVELGHDLKAEKARQRLQSARSFAAVAAAYQQAKLPHWRNGTARLNKLYLTGRAYFGPLHSAPVGELTRADICARLAQIAAERGPGTARQCRLVASAMFSWAMGEGLCETSPLIGARRIPAAPARDRVLSNDELAHVWRACGDDAYGAVVKLLILTGARRQEIGGMCWSEFDLKTGVWCLPSERSKNHRSHTLPLPPAALAIINSVLRTERDCLFGEKTDGGLVTWSKHKARLDKRLGDSVRSWCVHDLRRTAATRMADLGVQPHIIEQILNHSSGHKAGIAGVYNRSSYKAEVRAALQRWSEHVLALAEGRAGSNIVALAHA
jgi:integrase